MTTSNSRVKVFYDPPFFILNVESIKIVFETKGDYRRRELKQYIEEVGNEIFRNIGRYSNDERRFVEEKLKESVEKHNNLDSFKMKTYV